MKQLLVVLVVIFLGVGIYALFFMQSTAPVTPQQPATTSSQTQSNPDTSSGVAKQTYTNTTYGFSLKYPADITPSSTFSTSYLAAADWSLFAQADQTSGAQVVSLLIPKSNEVESAELRVGVSTSSKALANCLIAPKDSGLATTSSVSLRGVPFKRFTIADAAMSHHLDAHVLRTINNGVCYSIEEVVFGTNPQVYQPPRTVPFTTAEGFAALVPLLESFVFTNDQPANGNTTSTQPVVSNVGDTQATSAEGMHCGGFIQNAPTCPENYHCKLGLNPDTGGVCVAN